MAWGSIEYEPEVAEWIRALTVDERAQAFFYIDLLEEKGVHLGEPYTRQLSGKLRELRFFVGREQRRITYVIASGRRMPLLTTFRKTKQREQREVARAKRAMEAWLNRQTKGSR